MSLSQTFYQLFEAGKSLKRRVPMAPLVPLYTKTQELRHHISLEPCRIGSDLDRNSCTKEEFSNQLNRF